MKIDIYSSYYKKIVFLVSIVFVPILMFSILSFIFELWIVGSISIFLYIIIITLAYIIGKVKTNDLLYRYIYLFDDKFELVDKYGNKDEFTNVYIDITKPSIIGLFFHLLLSYEIAAELGFIDSKKNNYDGHISKKTYKLLSDEYSYLRIH